MCVSGDFLFFFTSYNMNELFIYYELSCLNKLHKCRDKNCFFFMFYFENVKFLHQK